MHLKSACLFARAGRNDPLQMRSKGASRNKTPGKNETKLQRGETLYRRHSLRQVDVAESHQQQRICSNLLRCWIKEVLSSDGAAATIVQTRHDQRGGSSQGVRFQQPRSERAGPKG